MGFVALLIPLCLWICSWNVVEFIGLNHYCHLFVFGMISFQKILHILSHVVAIMFFTGPEYMVLCLETGDALHNLRTNLQDPNNVLQSWDPTLVNPCTWFHVTCNNDNSVIRV